MSYILSALRKAERERNDSAAAPGQSVPLFPEAESTAGQRNTIVVVLLALCCGALAVLALVLFLQRNPAPVTVEAQNSGAELGGEKDLKPAQHQPVMSQSGGGMDTSVARSQPAAIEDKPRPQFQEESPATNQALAKTKDLPPLNITGYIYFPENPERSKLFVDGIVYRHKSLLVEDAVLERFYPDAVDVKYAGKTERIKIP